MGSRPPRFSRSTPRPGGQGTAEATFRNFFGIGYSEANAALDVYARGEGRRRTRLMLPASLADPPLGRVQVRPATLAEVARIVGESYINLAIGTFPEERTRYLVNA